MSSSPHEGSLGGLLPAVSFGIDSEVLAKPRPPGSQYAFLAPYTLVTSGPSSASPHFNGPAHADDFSPHFGSPPEDFFENAFGDGFEEHLVPDFPQDEGQGYGLHSPGPVQSYSPPVKPYPSKSPCRTRSPPRRPPPPGLLPILVPSSIRAKAPRQHHGTDCQPSHHPAHHQREVPAFLPQPQDYDLDDLPHNIQDIKEIIHDPSYPEDYYRESFRTKQRPDLNHPADTPDDDVRTFFGSGGRIATLFPDEDVERLRAAILKRDQEFNQQVMSPFGNSPDAKVTRQRHRRWWSTTPSFIS